MIRKWAKNTFGVLWMIFVGINFVLYAYADWMVWRDNFLAFLSPFSHLQALVILFSMPAFWISTVGLLISYSVYSHLENQTDDK